MKLTDSQFKAITRYHFGLGPKPWLGHPHISVSDLGRAEFDRVTHWWAQWAPWNAWLESGKKGPRPKVWRLVPPFAWQLRIEWKRAHWSPPPPPQPGPPVPPPPPSGSERFQRISISGQNPMDALMWHGCKMIAFTADPNPAYGQWVTRENADLVRRAGKEVAVWYVPDQISHARALEAAQVLGTNTIMCDCETLDRFNRAVANGVRIGIANLSAIWEDERANKMISSGEFLIINEFYNNQSRRRRPDNHNLPVTSLCVAVYNGCSDSQEGDCWEPHIADYRANGWWWNSMSVYSVNMTPRDWNALP